MARIKFLDILEETQSGHTPRVNTRINTQSQERDVPQDRFFRRERVFDRSEVSEPVREFRNEPRIPTESRLSFAGMSRAVPAPQKQSFSLEDNRILWAGALFVFFGGLLFLSGYWFGKSVTDSVKQESLSVLNEAASDFRREELNTMSVADLPVITPVEPATPKVEAKKSLPVVQPTVVEEAPKPKPATPKPVPIKEFVIQVSTHSAMESARQVEDMLRTAGFSAYTSESMVGSAIYFRVRIRGFNNKAQADKVLTEVKSLGLGTDGYVLTLD